MGFVYAQDLRVAHIGQVDWARKAVAATMFKEDPEKMKALAEAKVSFNYHWKRRKRGLSKHPMRHVRADLEAKGYTEAAITYALNELQIIYAGKKRKVQRKRFEKQIVIGTRKVLTSVPIPHPVPLVGQLLASEEKKRREKKRLQKTKEQYAPIFEDLKRKLEQCSAEVTELVAKNEALVEKIKAKAILLQGRA